MTFSDTMTVGGLILLALGVFFYLLPTAISSSRNTGHRGMIFFINLAFGWTVLGWIAALIWAIVEKPQEKLAPGSGKNWAEPKTKRFIIGGVVILAALAYIIYGGMQEALVYFKMPTELRAEQGSMKGKFVRMGGMVVKGSLQRDLANLTYRFEITDGSTQFPVFFKGIPPDLFVEGKGAVVEGRIGDDGVFQATTIMAKHAEDYSPHADGKSPNKSFVPAKEAGAK